MERIFAADSIAKSYGRRTVLRVASVWAAPGMISVLFGRNGCGKSSLLKVGAGLLRADAGMVHFRGRVYARPRLHRLAAAGLFYLPDANLISPAMTLRQHLRALEWRFGGTLTADEADELGVAELLDRPARGYSGGETRRAELAVCIARRPLCLLADEPFAGVAPADGERLAVVLRRMARRGCAIIATGHEVPELMRLADEVVWMSGGSTHGLGTADQAYANEQFRRDYLGPSRR